MFIKKKIRIAKETLEIYVPIALRLGMNKLRLELEEISFRTLNPYRYNVIVKAVENHRGNKIKFLEDIKEKIQERLGDLSIDTEIFARQKRIHIVFIRNEKKKLGFKCTIFMV